MNAIEGSGPCGLGIESEGFLLTNEGQAAGLINEVPAVEWVIREAILRNPRLKNCLSAEELSFHLELKTKEVHGSLEEAAAEIFNIRRAIDPILRAQGLKLLFSPVMPVPFRLIPASLDRESRAAQLFEKWGSTADGKELLRHTAIAVVQLNDSRVFNGIPRDQILSHGRSILASFTPEVMAEMTKTHRGERSWAGLTRQEHLRKLILAAKGEWFTSRGYSTEEILIPPVFKNDQELLRWMAAHANSDDITKVSPKDAHAYTGKIKQIAEGGLWMFETRMTDSTASTEQELIAILKAPEQHLRQFNLAQVSE